MLIEGIYFSLNLGFFLAFLWSLWAPTNISLTRKVFRMSYFLLYAAAFYALFYYYNQSYASTYTLKRILFGNLLFFTIILVVAGSIYLYIKTRILTLFAMVMTVGTFLFFYFYGMEQFYLLGNRFYSLSLLKLQNPLIFIVFLILFAIQDKKIRFSIFILFMAILLFIHQRRIEHYQNEPPLYARYIPYEFFFDSDGYIFEALAEGRNRRDLRGGLYIEKKSDAPQSDRLYQFNLRKVRKIHGQPRRYLQQTVTEFEFPIVYYKNEMIQIYEISRSFRGKNKKCIIDVRKKTLKMVGPIF